MVTALYNTLHHHYSLFLFIYITFITWRMDNISHAKDFRFLLQQYFISHFTDHLETSWRLVSHQKQTNLSSAATGSICHESSGNFSFFHLFNDLLDNHRMDMYLHDCLGFIIVLSYHHGTKVFEVTSLSATTSAPLYARMLLTCVEHVMQHVLKLDFFGQMVEEMEKSFT